MGHQHVPAHWPTIRPVRTTAAPGWLKAQQPRCQRRSPEPAGPRRPVRHQVRF